MFELTDNLTAVSGELSALVYSQHHHLSHKVLGVLARR